MCKLVFLECPEILVLHIHFNLWNISYELAVHGPALACQHLKLGNFPEQRFMTSVSKLDDLVTLSSYHAIICLEVNSGYIL